MNEANTAAVTAVDDIEFATTRRALAGWQRLVWRAVASVFVAWRLWILLVEPVDPTISRTVHVFGGAALGFALFALFAPGAGPVATRVPWYDWPLIFLCLLIPQHYIGDASGIEMRSFMDPSGRDSLAAFVGLLIVLEFARRTAGMVMPIICLTFIAYCFVGPWLPGVLYHQGVTWDTALAEIFGYNGVLGTIIQVSASFIIMFVVFAGFLQTSKAGDWFNDLALAAVGRARGGPAKVTVLSGILFGTISGSAVANVSPPAPSPSR